MKLKFWGTRGSCAAPFSNRSEFGGNTSCVSVRSGNCWLIFDGGSGIIPLAAEIRSAAAEVCSVKILISHFHLDHVIGLPMFMAALPANAEVTLYTAPCGEETRGEALASLIGPPLWPVRLTDVCPRLKFADLSHNEDNDIGEGITVRAMRSNHPNGTSVFRAVWDGREIVYGLDCEITDEFEGVYADFAKDCDHLIFDGAYTDEDYRRCAGFGHSAFTKAAVIAEKTGAGKLYVTHFDYAYTDSDLRAAEKTLTVQGGRIVFAREGHTEEI